MPRATSGSIPLKEHNTHMMGRTGSGTEQFLGPAVIGLSGRMNPTKSGGINRATEGMQSKDTTSGTRGEFTDTAKM